VKAAFRSTTQQGVVDVEAFWSDFKEFGGLMVPGKLVTLRDGQKYSELILTDLKFNVGLDPKTFAK
jgi:hypothetical protein